MIYSRKRFQEVLRLCKSATKNEKLPWTQRLRAAELVCLIYGLELPGGSSRRDQKLIKELLEERAFEKSLKANLKKQKHAIPDSSPESETTDIDADAETTVILKELLSGT